MEVKPTELQQWNEATANTIAAEAPRPRRNGRRPIGPFVRRRDQPVRPHLVAREIARTITSGDRSDA